MCFAGAASPGPSLAVVARNTIDGGRLQGVATAVGHGLGIGIYAFAAVAGVAAIVAASPGLHRGIEVAGALYLLWMAARTLLPSDEAQYEPRSRRGFGDGFLIAFLNPKVAVFFLALLGAFLPADATWVERGGVASMAAGIDAGWYSICAIGLSRVTLDGGARRAIDWGFALLLVAVAAGLLLW